MRLKLDELSVIVLNSVRSACDEVVDMFLKANNIAANHKMTFMERAALRSECKRLTRFLRMVDIMMNDFLLSMVSDSVRVLCEAIAVDMSEEAELVPYIETSTETSVQDMALTRVDRKSPLYRVVVMFKKRLSGEEWEEVVSIKPTLDQLTKKIDQVSFLSIFSLLLSFD